MTEKKQRVAVLTRLHDASTILMILVCLITFDSFGQAKRMNVSFAINIKVDTTRVRVYNPYTPPSHSEIKTVVLKTGFGDSEITNAKDAKVLDEVGCNIISIDLVYTDYHKDSKQDLLNKKRLMQLYFVNPDIFNQSLIQWKYVEQLGFKDEADARNLFHGFVIKYYKVPKYEPTTLKMKLGEVKSKAPEDTTMFKAFNKSIKSPDELVCVDLTGSMSPYYLQVFSWLHLRKNGATIRYSFFNDGDEMPDHLKRTGNVGGVYLFGTNSIDTVTKYAYECITNGSGGDSPENNIESVLKAIKKYPDIKSVVMVVDNWANMRDYSLMSQLKIPVKVIVCGTRYFEVKSPVNTQYLDLARATGGSVYTMEEDLHDLAKKKEGDEITIEGTTYVIRGGRFMPK
ncbi:MAG: hypothetical protein RL090_1577 [Bacteroidota bacterium]|jgi:hypothetical protein